MSDLDKTIKILIIDDSQLMRVAMKKIFQHIGFENVAEADGGESALDMLQKEPYQLIMLDWIMPEMRGIEVLKAIKEIEQYRDVPVIVASAEKVEENVAEAKDAGAADYLSKPYTPEMLEEKLNTVFSVD